MRLPTLFDPCPICGDEPAYCPRQRTWADSPESASDDHGPGCDGPFNCVCEVPSS